jgi:hypothetical protein
LRILHLTVILIIPFESCSGSFASKVVVNLPR